MNLQASAGQAEIGVFLVSTMGLEASGLAVAAGRYSKVLRAEGWRAEAIVVGSQHHSEHGSAEHVAKFDDLTDFCRSRGHPPIIVWIGLPTDEDKYQAQLECMRLLAQQRALNIVLPERTERPEPQAYREFERLAIDGFNIQALIHLNALQAKIWSQRLPFASAVLPVPVPDRLFATGTYRLCAADKTHSPTIAFMGRLTHRKGADLLLDAWPGWRAAFASAGLDVSLNIFGREFGSDSRIAEHLRSLISAGDHKISWHPKFFDTQALGQLPKPTVALALSRQDFDGIAISEFLAVGVPVIATETDGHVALSRESQAVVIVPGLKEMRALATMLLRDDVARRRLSEQGREDMRLQRGEEQVGLRFSKLLRDVLERAKS